MECHDQGDVERAISLLRSALEQQPQHFEATFNLGVFLHQAGLNQEARARLERALLVKPGNIDSRFALAQVLIELDAMHAAESLLQRVIEVAPENIDAHLSLATIAQALGSPETASRRYERALLANPTSARVWHAWSMQRDWKPGEPDIAALIAASRVDDCTDEEQVLFAYALGKMHDDCGDYHRAFEAYREANELQATRQNYDYRDQVAFFARHKNGQTGESLQVLAQGAITDDTPVFVLGMPRSGTSLVEQMLASHPSVSGAGEVQFTHLLSTVCEAQTGRPFPEDLGSMDPAVMTQAALEYVNRLRASVGLESGVPGRVIDKLPHNFLRLGLLATVMPRASFVLCERDPMDVCLSIYRQHFLDSHGYACSLAELGRYYRLYCELITHWDEQFPGSLYRVAYDRLITDTEGELYKLLSYLKLPYDDACLSFHEHPRLVATPSAAQVRRPVYTHALGHWRRYDEWLAPLREALSGVDA